MTTRKAISTTEDEQGLTFDMALLSDIMRRRVKRIIGLGLSSFVAVLLLGVFAIQQSFTANVSIAIQRPQQAGTNLLAGLGVSSGTTNYIGVIRSRRFAEKVERQLHLQEFYHLPTRREAIDKLMNGVRVQDSVGDGLLYIYVSLNGPPRLAPNMADERKRVKQKAADAANAYAAALSEYMKTTDVDRETVLTREADKQLHKSRQEYELAIQRFIAFIRTSRSPVLSAMTSGGTTPGASGMAPTANLASELQNLYQSRGRVLVDLQAAITAKQKAEAFLNNQTEHLSLLPPEDPLLTAARNLVNRERMALKHLQIEYADDNPLIVRAKVRLQLAEANLRVQMQGFKKGLTTEQGDAKIKVDILRSRLTEIQRQIDDAEGKFLRDRDRATDMQKLSQEVTIRFEILKTTATQRATLTLQTGASKNRMTVVDTAIAPISGQPSILTSCLVGALVAVVVPGLMVFIEYLKRTL